MAVSIGRDRVRVGFCAFSFGDSEAEFLGWKRGGFRLDIEP